MPDSRPVAPLITVITPAYNVAEYVEEAIASVLAQTEKRFEYLIVDDGSTDETVSLIEAAIAQSPGVSISLIRTDHAGSAVARNAALEVAKGEYIAFLDGDDRWRPDFLADQLRLIQSLPAEVGAVYCRARVMTAAGRVVGVRWQGTGRCDFDTMLVMNCPPRNGSSLLIKKSCFDEAGLFEASLKSGVDFEMWLRIGLKSQSPVFWGNGAYLLDLRLRPGAISNNLDNRFASMGALLEQYGPSLKRMPLGRAYIRPALLAYRAGYDMIADRWTEIAKTAGTSEILKDQFGARVLAYNAASPSVRAKLRSAKGTVRSGILAAPAKLASVLKK